MDYTVVNPQDFTINHTHSFCDVPPTRFGLYSPSSVRSFKNEYNSNKLCQSCDVYNNVQYDVNILF